MHCIPYLEMWLSLVERCVRDAEVAGSNPVISTIETYDLVGKVKALTSVGAFLYYITIPILPYKLISVSIDFEIKKEHYCL